MGRPALCKGFLLACFLFVVHGWAERLPMRFITTADGLARDDLHAIMQDRFGRLWFATSEGVSRFDGVKFQTFRVADGIPGRDVHAIVQTANGSIWIATSGGLAYFDPKAGSGGKSFVAFPLTSSAGGVDRILEDHMGAIWAGSYLGLFRIAPHSRKVDRIDLMTGNERSIFAHDFAGVPDPHLPIYAVFEDATSNLWVGTSDGLFVAKRDQINRFSPVSALSGFVVHAIAQEANGRLWIGTDAGLIEGENVDGPENFKIVHRYRRPEGLPDDVVKTLLVTPDGQLWVGTTSGLAKRINAEADGRCFRSFAITGGLSYGDVDSISRDSAGNLWVATDGGGAIKITLTGFTTFDRDDGFVPAYVGSLSLDRHGYPLALSLANGGLAAYSYDGSRFSGYRLNGPRGFAPSYWVPWHQVLTESRSGNWWVASYAGLLRYAPGKPATNATLTPDQTINAKNGLQDNEVVEVFEDSKRRLWICTFSGGTAYSRPNARAGISMLEPGSRTVHSFSERDGLPPLDSFKPRGIFEDRTGQIWIGMHRTGIARFRAGRFEVFTSKDGVPFGGIRQIYQDAHGNLWLASTSGGLAKIADPAAASPTIKTFTTVDGLSSDEIQTITEDKWGRIYAGTGLGVDRLDPQTGHILHYTAADGLAPGEVEDSIRDRNGNLWFGTLTGLSRLTPRADEPTLAPPTRIIGLRVSGHPREVDDGGVSRMTLPNLSPEENNIEIEYASASAETQADFEYRMEGGPSSRWSAPTPLRTVLFSNLRDGRYHLVVRSVSPDGLRGEPAEVSFRVLPPIWERWWFITSALLFLSGAAAVAYRFRVAQLLATERMRTRIACDIHDDVGSAISKIVIMSDVAQQKGIEAAHSTLAQISATSRGILDNIGDMVAAINPHTDRWEDVVSRMREFGTQIFEARDVPFEFRSEGIPMHKRISPETLRHLYLIFKEVVNNAAKHSGCSRAGGRMFLDQADLVLEITDDGAGFDGAPKPGRNGISNLRQRAAALHGRIDWTRQAGTTVSLRIPLRNYAGWFARGRS